MGGRVAGVACVLLLCACGGAAEELDSATWVGDVTVEGSVTTVRNISGSVWGGLGRLDPEAEIGVAEGPDEYMFGRLHAIHGTGDQILVADLDATIVRAYDWNGEFLFNVGAAGQGPGEYGFPASIGQGPSGRILIPDFGGQRMLRFSPEGNFENQWLMTGAACCIVPMLVAHDGTIYMESMKRLDTERAIASFASDGTPGVVIDPPEYDVPKYSLEFQGRVVGTNFAPRMAWAIGYAGEIISGPGHETRIRIERQDGTELQIARTHDLVPVESEESEWYRRMLTASLRRVEPDWTWNATETPRHKPAFSTIIPTPEGRLWLLRQGRGRRLPTCDPDAETDAEFTAGECWRDTQMFDVYGTDGRFLGTVPVPDEVVLWTARPWISGDTVIANVEDLDGVYKVVRYRLNLPDDARRVP